MHVAIVGAGGVGGWLGAKLLHRANCKITFVLRSTSAQLQAMQSNGLRYQATEEQDEFDVPAEGKALSLTAFNERASLSLVVVPYKRATVP
eukprot:SAG31_NODE_3999_length_3677_cov_4.742873_1_plen_91_part_00